MRKALPSYEFNVESQRGLKVSPGHTACQSPECRLKFGVGLSRGPTPFTLQVAPNQPGSSWPLRATEFSQ